MKINEEVKELACDTGFLIALGLATIILIISAGVLVT